MRFAGPGPFAPSAGRLTYATSAVWAHLADGDERLWYTGRWHQRPSSARVVHDVVFAEPARLLGRLEREILELTADVLVLAGVGRDGDFTVEWRRLTD